MDTPDLRSHLLAILAADVAGYSRLMSLDDRATVAALDAARAVFREHIAAHGGRVIDMAGDSVLAVFETATRAMNTALEVQARLARLAADVPEDRRMAFRIGIHVGDVIEKADGTVYGDGVNVASRLEGLAVPGAVAVSQAVHGMVARRVDAVFEDIGEQTVKNIAQPVRAFRARHRLPGEAANPESMAGRQQDDARVQYGGACAMVGQAQDPQRCNRCRCQHWRRSRRLCRLLERLQGRRGWRAIFCPSGIGRQG